MLSSAGVEALKQWRFPAQAEKVRGRVIYPDGRIQEFLEGRDFKVQRITVKGTEVARSLVGIPAGLNGDCILEWKWEQRPTTTRHFYRTKNGYFYLDLFDPPESPFLASRPYPVKRTRIVIAPDTGFRFALIPQKGAKAPTRSIDKLAQTCIDFEELRADEALPFLPQGLQDGARLMAYVIPDHLKPAIGLPTQDFWRVAAGRHWELGQLKLKSYPDPPKEAQGAFQALSHEVLGGLPDGPAARARMIWERLNQRVRNFDHPTDSELAGVPEAAKAGRWMADGHPDEWVHRKYTNSVGMRILYRNLLDEAAVPYRLVAVLDANRGSFNPEIRDVYQFHWLLIQIPNGDHPPLWVDTDLRFGQPGDIEAQFLGTLCLEMDAQTGFTQVRDLKMGADVRPHRRRINSKATVTPTHWNADVQTSLEGAPAATLRAEFMKLKASERIPLWQDLSFPAKSEWTGTVKGISGLEDASAPLSFAASVRGEAVDAPFTMPPFPGLTLPFPIPPLAEHRSEAIRMPQPLDLEAVAEIELPEGYRIRPAAPIEVSTAFGRVSWHASQEGRKVKVFLQAAITQMTRPASEYPALKNFLAALQSALNQDLTVTCP